MPPASPASLLFPPALRAAWELAATLHQIPAPATKVSARRDCQISNAKAAHFELGARASDAEGLRARAVLVCQGGGEDGVEVATVSASVVVLPAGLRLQQMNTYCAPHGTARLSRAVGILSRCADATPSSVRTQRVVWRALTRRVWRVWRMWRVWRVCGVCG
eukprot:942536-Rhodomonas_salina.1